MQNGLFIVLEGYEGVGKTTQCKILSDYFKNLGKDVVLCREPGGTPANEKIRDIIIAHGKDLPIESLVNLFIAAKKNLLVEVIEPALAAGKVVILDRYTPSLLAYQTATGEVSMRQILEALRLSRADRQPDVYFHLTTNFGILSSRITRRNVGNEVEDEFEKQQLTRSHAIYRNYDTFFDTYATFVNVRTIDAAQSIEDVHLAIVTYLQELYTF